ncbi:hypothetical protein BDV33DRAFT_186185 [Aspergillus novoparasiticus]|uniref:Uncharacterized protein n=1 Tax=Aspergillus novoparasiticus TaxID=986946 RepID=A0A5N6E5D4_9EURO|nr:hypothetical protein BDV33DRAFT_186185 [Aspergillus novoparasiticus]
MSRNNLVRLLKLVKPKSDGPFMRLADTLLEDEEAEEVTRQMYDIIRSSYTLEEPDHTSHRKALEESLEYRVTLRIRDPEETDEDYLNRMDRVNTWPARSTATEAKWIWRAQVVIRAMKFAHENTIWDSAGVSREWVCRFRPKDFYEYSWICLREGQGVRAWNYYGQPPPLPPNELSTQEEAEWYYKAAERDQGRILALWHEGQELQHISDQLALKDLPAPATEETMAAAESKEIRIQNEVPEHLKSP